MKKAFSYMAILCLLSVAGCKTPFYPIGTPEAEFKSGSRNAKVISMNKDMTVYLLSVHKMSEYENIFYYFTDGKLIQVDHGEQRPDILIKTQ